MAYPVQKQRLAGGYRDRFLHRPVRHCGLAFFDRSAAVQQSGGFRASEQQHGSGQATQKRMLEAVGCEALLDVQLFKLLT